MKNWTLFFFGIAHCSLVFWLSAGANRSEFLPFLTVFSTVFGLSFWLFFRRDDFSKTEISSLLAVAVLSRAAVVFLQPNFSDDFFRFLWDGQLVVRGIHPFAFFPSQFVENQTLASNFPSELFPLLNSQNYFSVYPPVCQFVFATVVKICGNDIFWGVVSMKIFLFVCEIGSLFLLWKIGQILFPKNQKLAALPALIYGLHPLPIFENVGNCHFEAAMIFCLLASIFHLQKRQVVPAGLWFSLSVASKLLPLLFLPLLFFFLDKKLRIKFLATVVASLLFVFAPLFDLEVFSNLFKSLNLYFQKFEFNASFYYIFRWLGWRVSPYNLGYLIAPALAVATGLAAGWLAVFRLKTGDFRQLLAGICGLSCLYFFCSAAVHPWYLTLPLAFGGLLGWRFPLVWAGAAVLSYSHYDGGVWQENYCWIALEYLLVAAAWLVFDLSSGLLADKN